MKRAIVSIVLVMTVVVTAGYAVSRDKEKTGKDVVDIKMYQSEPTDRKYTVIGPVQVTGTPQSTRGELLLMLKQQAAGMDADAVIIESVSSTRTGGNPGGTFCPDGSATCVPIKSETYSATSASGTAIKFTR